jgi:hypothetical protein
MPTATLYRAQLLFSGDLDENKDRALVTSENGFFSFQDVNPGIPYQVSITAKNFAEWKSATITLEPAQYKIISDIELRIEVRTTVDVRYDSVQVAAEQIRLEEKQRVFGIVPNFYVSYDQGAEALTPKMICCRRQASGEQSQVRTGLGRLWQTCRCNCSGRLY